MKILVIDDHPIVRQGLVTLLHQIGPGTVLLETGSAEDALPVIEANVDLDVVVLDLVLPGMSGSQAITAFAKIRPELPVIMLSSSEDAQDARKALALGALGYVPKSASHTTLLSAVRMVMEGDIYVPPLVLSESKAQHSPMLAGRNEGRQSLTDRQIEVLQRVSSGQPNKLIARELNLSEKTVKAHITAIFRALNVINRTQAASVGRELGLL